jgi:Uncharacterised protein family UPF0547
MEILAIWTVLAIVAAIVAGNKGRSGAGWFFLCLLLTPLALLVLLALPTLDAPGTKMCPQCAETVKAAAKICHFCHYEFADSAASAKAKLKAEFPEELNDYLYRVEKDGSVSAVNLGFSVPADEGVVQFQNMEQFRAAVLHPAPKIVVIVLAVALHGVLAFMIFGRYL